MQLFVSGHPPFVLYVWMILFINHNHFWMIQYILHFITLKLQILTFLDLKIPNQNETTNWAVRCWGCQPAALRQDVTLQMLAPSVMCNEMCWNESFCCSEQKELCMSWSDSSDGVRWPFININFGYQTRRSFELFFLFLLQTSFALFQRYKGQNVFIYQRTHLNLPGLISIPRSNFLFWRKCISN